MIYLGGLFVLRDWAGVLKRYELYVGIVVKMVLFPIAFHALLVAVPPMLGLGAIPRSMADMMTIIAGLPTMSAIVMFSEREHNMPRIRGGTGAGHHCGEPVHAAGSIVSNVLTFPRRVGTQGEMNGLPMIMGTVHWRKQTHLWKGPDGHYSTVNHRCHFRFLRRRHRLAISCGSGGTLSGGFG